MTERRYSSTAGAYTLSVSAPDSATSITLSSTAGLPTQFPYTLVLDVGTVAEEVVTVTNASGSVLTVTRGEDGSAAQTHQAGAIVRHMATARDFREPQQHMVATVVHGVSSALVGTTDVQTLQNKTLDTSNSIAQAAVTGLASTLADIQSSAQGVAFRAQVDVSGAWAGKTLLTIADPFGGQPYDIYFNAITTTFPGVETAINVQGNFVGGGSPFALPATAHFPVRASGSNVLRTVSHRTLTPLTGGCTITANHVDSSFGIPSGTTISILAVAVRNNE